MNIRTRKALTLTELLVSTILMGIVMTGVAAFSLFVKQARDSTGKGTILAVQTATAMHYMVADANKAVGDSSDRGVVSSAGQESVCFRHDGGSSRALCGDGMRQANEECDDGNAFNGDGCSSQCTVDQAGMSPTFYGDDTWACYWYDAASDALWKCSPRDAVAGAPPADFADCQTGTGEVRLVTLDPASPDYFEVVDDADGRLTYVDITLNTIADPGQAAHTITNPTQQLFTRVSPPAHGR